LIHSDCFIERKIYDIISDEKEEEEAVECPRRGGTLSINKAHGNQ
jgi:hypothetical protein